MVYMSSLTRHAVIPRTMCFVLYNDELLLMKAGKDKPYAGMYEPVGGHIEKGEDIIKSANREILEESGLTVTDTKLKGVIHVANFFGNDIMMFITLSHVRTNQVTPNAEAEELAWIKLHELDTLPMLEDMKPLLQRVLKLGSSQFLSGVTEFDGKNKLVDFRLTVY